MSRGLCNCPAKKRCTGPARAILSDAQQRKVYDAVYAEQMREWERQRSRHQQAQAEREAAARAAASMAR